MVNTWDEITTVEEEREYRAAVEAIRARDERMREECKVLARQLRKEFKNHKIRIAKKSAGLVIDDGIIFVNDDADSLVDFEAYIRKNILIK